MSKRFIGKNVLVTGGSSGIGLAAAKAFAAEGATVFIAARRAEQLAQAVEEVGHGASGIQCDISEFDELSYLYEQIRSKAGCLDVLFANAGGGEFVPLEHIDEAHFEKHFGVNVRGTLFSVQKALPLMRRGSSIVLNGSMLSIKGVPGLSVYAATKAAIRALARCWAVELSEHGIRVNVVSPGPVVTPGFRGSLGFDEERIRTYEAQMSSTIPLKRSGMPQEIADAVLFLASTSSSYITGTELFVDGGAVQV